MAKELVKVEDRFRMSERQREVVLLAEDPDVDEILAHGAIRSGKTQICAKILAHWAMTIPGSTYMVLRRSYVQLDDSTKRAVMSGDGQLEPAVPFEVQRPYNGKRERLELVNGSEILFRSLKEDLHRAKQDIRGTALSGAFVDQIEEFEDDEEEEVYQELVSRLAHPRGPLKVLATANPAPESHWVYRRFIGEERQPQTRQVGMTIFDNAVNLPENVMRAMKRAQKLRPAWYKRYALGEWGAFGGKRFRDFSRERHVIPAMPLDPGWEYLEGIDYGSASPFCCLVVAVTFEGEAIVVAEHYEPERTLGYHVKQIHAQRRALPSSPSASYLDPSAWSRQGDYDSVAIQLQEHGVWVAKALNERLGGWARIEEMLAANRLKVFDSCQNTIAQLLSARYKEGTDDIEKKNDHAIDALRYVIMTRWPHPLALDDDIDRPRDYRERFARRLTEGTTVRRRSYVTIP